MRLPVKLFCTTISGLILISIFQNCGARFRSGAPQLKVSLGLSRDSHPRTSTKLWTATSSLTEKTTDTIMIQALLDRRGIVDLPMRDTPYVINRPLLVYSDTTINLGGTLQLVKGFVPDPDSHKPFRQGYNYVQYGMLQIQPGSQNVVIQGGGTIDGQNDYAEPGHVDASEACCMGGIVAGGTLLGDYHAGIRNVTIRNLTILRTQTWPVSLDGTDTALLQNLHIRKGGTSVQFAHGTTNARAVNLDIADSKDQGFSFYSGVSYSSIEDSRVSNTGGFGISVFSDYAGSGGVAVMADGRVEPESASGNDPDNMTSSHHILIARNTVIGTDGTGIGTAGGFRTDDHLQEVQVYNLLHQRPYEVTIENNNVVANSFAGIALMPCDRCAVRGNEIHQDGVSKADVIPGVLTRGAKHITIFGNKIYDEGQGTKQGVGIQIEYHLPDDSQEISIVKNVIWDRQVDTEKTMISAYRGLNPYGITHPNYPVYETANAIGGFAPREKLLSDLKPLSLIRVGQTVMMVNGDGHYCRFQSPTYLASFAPNPSAEQATFTTPPFGLYDDGYCGPLGRLFKIGDRLFTENLGGHYCEFNSLPDFLRMTKRSNADGLLELDGLPIDAVSDGRCDY